MPKGSLGEVGTKFPPVWVGMISKDFDHSESSKPALSQPAWKRVASKDSKGRQATSPGMDTGVHAEPGVLRQDRSVMSHSSPMLASNTNDPAPSEYEGGTGIHHDVAIVNPSMLPFVFMEELKRLGIRMIPVNHEDPSWTVNCLAVAPGRVIMSDRVSARTQEAMDRAGISIRLVDYDRVGLGGGGIHCSTSPLVRDPV